MAATPSNMMPLGTLAPDFSLPDTASGLTIAYSAIAGKQGTVVLFICNHCPYVIHINEALVKIANAFMPKGIGFVAISSNDVDRYPQDGPEQMALHSQEVGYPFPYLYDESQAVAKAYQAACTPDIYVFDANKQCVYRGQFDDTRPNQGEASGADLIGALDALLAGRPVPAEQRPSIGCNIKWK